MNRTYFYGALLVIGSLGLTGSAMAKDNDKDHDHHGDVRQVREHHEEARHEAHEAREAREARERHLREQREHARQQWARQHEHHDNGKHLGWEKGKHNPHQNAAFHPPAPNTAAAARPVHTSYPHHPTRPHQHHDPAAQGK